MKINKNKIINALILFLIGLTTVFGQQSNIADIKEEIAIFTDRTIFITGEDIHFNAEVYCYNQNNLSELDKQFNINLNKNIENNISKVVYVELVKPNGESIIRSKFKCINSNASGFIPIPNSLISGIYYIKVYTKYMRNFGPNSYSYTQLKIVNPFSSDVQKELLLKNGVEIATPVNINVNSDLITILMDKEQYQAKENATLTIKEKNGFDNYIKNLSLTIIPNGTFDETNKLQLETNDSTCQFFYPEQNGLTLTGTLKDIKSGQLTPNAIINLSILGKQKDFIAVRTNSKGRFFFKLPDFYGSKEIFICSETNEDLRSIIYIDPDFCTKSIKLAPSAFSLNEEELLVVLKLARNYQVMSFYPKPKYYNPTTETISKVFYDNPQEKLFFDRYIQLPSIEDYINEIIPTLKIRKQGGMKYFKIFRNQPEIEIFKPLVLLDHVAIDDPQRILTLSPQNMSYVETINAPYIKGNMIYGGIISFVSVKSDFAGINLPSTGTFLEYTFYSNNCFTPVNELLKNNQPDARNTVLWEPSIKIGTTNSCRMTFNFPDTPGNYLIVLKGLTIDGKIVEAKKIVSVGKSSNL